MTKFSFRTFFQYLLCFAMLAISSTSLAQTYGAFSQKSIYGSLKRDELESFNSTVSKVLSEEKDGKVTTWKSPSEGRSFISAQIFAEDSYLKSGMPCKRLNALLSDNSYKENWVFDFCRQNNGQWKALSESSK